MGIASLIIAGAAVFLSVIVAITRFTQRSGREDGITEQSLRDIKERLNRIQDDQRDHDRWHYRRGDR